jgi:hypothetical protein
LRLRRTRAVPPTNARRGAAGHGGWAYLDFKINGQPQAAKNEWLKTGRDSACFFTPLNTVQDLTIGAAELAVPNDAKKEYGKACESLAAGKIADAEKHLRKATELFPNILRVGSYLAKY